MTNRFQPTSNTATVQSRPVSKPVSILVTEERDPSEVVLMKAVSELDEETKTRESDEFNRNRPTIGLIVKDHINDDTF